MVNGYIFCRFTAVMAFTVLTTLGSLHPVRADLSDEQKDKIRAALPLPLLHLGGTFSFGIRTGFDLTTNNEADSAVRRARLNFFLKLGQPEDDVKGVRYLRTISDLKLLLDDPDAKEACDRGEKLALKVAKTSPPKLRARLLAFAGDFHADQGELKEAQAILSEALKLSPDTWEVWDAQAYLFYELASKVYGGDSGENLSNVQPWIDGKPSGEEQKRVIGYLTDGVAAASKAIALQEKAHPRAEERSPRPYFRRSLCLSMAEAFKACFDAQKNNKSVSFSEQSYRSILSDSTIQDVKNARACEPGNPYAIATYRFLRGVKTGGETGLATEATTALSELAALEKKPLPDKETRLRLLTTQSFLSVFVEDWATVTAKVREGLDISPNREPLMIMQLIYFFEKEKFAEAEVVASRLVASNDTTNNRLSLAKAQSKQNDFVGAERTLAPVVEREKGAALPAIFLATVRVKATSATTPDTEWDELTAFIQKVAADHKGTATRDNAVDLYLVVATLYALKDQEDDAKEILQRILALDEDNDAAKAMVALLP